MSYVWNSDGERVNPATSEQFTELLNFYQPATQVPLDVKTMTADTWDSGGAAMPIPPDSIFLRVYVDQNAFLFCSNTENDPDNGGVLYPSGSVYDLPCTGQTLLHTQNAVPGSNVSIYVTAFGE